MKAYEWALCSICNTLRGLDATNHIIPHVNGTPNVACPGGQMGRSNMRHANSIKTWERLINAH
jgi:5-methylcytosine-specific restriction endonuclease McrA